MRAKLGKSDLETEKKRIRKDVFKSKHKEGFKSSDELASWWIDRLVLQQGCCDYCKTPIEVIRDLIDQKLLKGRNTRGEGVRGRYLELERVEPDLGYSPDNCTLICYYCNNDKSNVYNRAEYIEFLAPAKNQHFMYLAKKLPKKEVA